MAAILNRIHLFEAGPGTPTQNNLAAVTASEGIGLLFDEVGEGAGIVRRMFGGTC